MDGWRVFAIVSIGDIVLLGLIFWRFRVQARAIARLLAEQHEEAVIPPSRATWQGGGMFLSAKSMGVIVLTPEAIIFRLPVGKDITLPIADINEIAENTWFRGNYRGGREWLIVKMKDGKENAFLVGYHAHWVREVKALMERQQAGV